MWVCAGGRLQLLQFCLCTVLGEGQSGVMRPLVRGEVASVGVQPAKGTAEGGVLKAVG